MIVILVASFVVAQFAPIVVGIAAVGVQIGCGLAAVVSLFKAEWAFALALGVMVLALTLVGQAADAVRGS